MTREEQVTLICKNLEEGIPLAETCRLDGMPARRTVYDWLADDEAFAARFARAREIGFDAIAEQCLEIADDRSQDVKIVGGEDNEREAFNSEFAARSKIRIETRLKLLAKWDPKRYGERQQVEHTGDAFKGATVEDMKRELAALVSDPAVRAVMKDEPDA
jgi:ribosomal protein S6E (S10)